MGIFDKPSEVFKKKKGRASWKPASILPGHDVGGEYRARWCENTPGNIQKKLAEGWEIVPNTQTEQVDPSNLSEGITEVGTIHDGKQTTSAIKHREMVLMRLPEDVGKERDKYHADLRKTRKMGLKQRVQDEAEKLAASEGIQSASIEGKIVID